MVRRRLLAALAPVLLFTAPVPAFADVIVALAVPLSGRQQAMGEDMREAAEAAVGDLNAAGGLLGERLTLAVEDDGCEQTRAAAAARALIDRKPALVVGHPCSGAAIAAAPVYAAAGLVFISPGARHPALTEKRAGPTIFRLAGRDDRQGAAAALWLTRSAPERRVALVHDRTGFARALAEGAARDLEAAGIAPVLALAIEAGRNDYGEVAHRLKKEEPEAVFFAGYPAEGALVLAGLRREGVTARFLGSDSLATDEFAAAAGDDQRASLRVLLPNEPGPLQDWSSSSHPDVARRSGASRALIARTYAAVEVWADGVRRAGSFEPERVRALLASGATSSSALGPVSFDAKGDARFPSFVPARWDGQRWVAGD
jgi:branched-chain amino acid transport system substrate-binding protein